MRKLFGVLAFLLLAGAVWLFLDRSVFVIRDVEVACDEAVDAQSVIRVSGVELGSRLRALDADKVARKVESTGEFEFISVERNYPSTVRLTVRRRVPAAMAEAGGLIVLMDQDGYVISASPEAPDADAVYVTGLDIGAYDIGRQVSAGEARIAAMGEVIRALGEMDARAYVSELNVADVNGLYIYSRTGIYVALGDEGEMGNKIVLMKYVLADLESRGETSGRLDVSSGDKADFSGS
jgi:cell division septal protein FtsQ